jgi:nucleoside-diphosphate-sugar epimerase
MRVLITGGGGFIGYHLGKKFMDEGHEAVLYDVVSRTIDIFEKGQTLPRFVEGTVTDVARLMDAVRENHIEGIVHTAAMPKPITCIEQPMQSFEVNVKGTLNVLEAARMAHLRVVYLSTQGVYGPTPDMQPLKEERRVNPITMYSCHKVASETMVEGYHLVYGVDAVTVRPSFVYGPGQNPQNPNAAYTWLVMAMRGEKVDLPDGADHVFDWTYIKDMVHGIFLATTVRPVKSRVFNISGGKNVTLSELAKAVMKVVPGSNIKLGPGYTGSVGGAEKGQSVGMRSCADLTRAKEELGYSPKYTIEKGIADYCEWLKKHPPSQ